MPEVSSASDRYLHRQLANRYYLTQLIGKGAMGRVYAAQDRLLADVEVAVKILTHPAEDDYFRQRFEQEAMACAALGQKSLHIVRVNDYGLTPEGMPFYVMEYLRGQTLRDLLKQSPTLPLPRLINLTWQIALGLKAAHEGVSLRGQTVHVIHRDLKPANVMILPNDSLGELVKLVDFGIAKLLSDQGHVSITQAYTGTLAYSSPEQLEGIPLDPRSDLYSFGVMVYQMLTGRLPLTPASDTFAGWYHAHLQQPLPSLPLEVPEPLRDLVMACLAKTPGERPASAAHVLALLEQLRETVPAALAPVAAPAPPPILRPQAPPTIRQTPPRPSRVPALLLGGAVALGVTGVLAWGVPRWLAQGTAGDQPTSVYLTAIEAGEQALLRENYLSAMAHFQAALKERPEDRLASTGLRVAEERYQASLATPTPIPTPPPTPMPTPPPAQQAVPVRPAAAPPPRPQPRYTPLLRRPSITPLPIPQRPAATPRPRLQIHRANERD
ncbi:MAG: serine/threonine-protein kinase [Thermostichales cyanobacterium BF4_bins_65]